MGRPRIKKSYSAMRDERDRLLQLLTATGHLLGLDLFKAHELLTRAAAAGKALRERTEHVQVDTAALDAELRRMAERAITTTGNAGTTGGE